MKCSVKRLHYYLICIPFFFCDNSWFYFTSLCGCSCSSFNSTIHTSVNLIAVSVTVLMCLYFSGVEGLQHCIDERVPTANEGDVVVALYSLLYLFVVAIVENAGRKMYLSV